MMYTFCMNKNILYIFVLLLVPIFVNAALPAANSNGKITKTQRFICDTDQKTGQVNMRSSIVADYTNSQGEKRRISCPSTICKGEFKLKQNKEFVQEVNLKDQGNKGNIPGDRIVEKGNKTICQNKSGKKGIPITDIEGTPMKLAENKVKNPQEQQEQNGKDLQDKISEGQKKRFPNGQPARTYIPPNVDTILDKISPEGKNKVCGAAGVFATNPGCMMN